MKKFFALLLSFLVAISLATVIPASAEDTEALIAEKDARIAELESQLAELSRQLEALTATPEPTVEPTPEPYAELKKGSKGDAVVKVQDRLKELGYLGGKSDGAYGNGTASAVTDFQRIAGLPETGVADSATQVALFSEEAPESPNPVLDESLYEKLDYKSNSRDPDAYTGTKIKFTGKIIQVMEDSGIAVFRIATKGNYDNIVYCYYYLPDNYKRFLEDDKVTVYATSTGIYTYETIMGGSVTIPSCVIDRIELR